MTNESDLSLALPGAVLFIYFILFWPLASIVDVLKLIAYLRNSKMPGMGGNLISSKAPKTKSLVGGH